MDVNVEDSLAALKLEDGIEGVKKLMPQKQLSKAFTDVTPKDEYLHIAMERPATSKSECLIGHRNSDQSTLSHLTRSLTFIDSSHLLVGHQSTSPFHDLFSPFDSIIHNTSRHLGLLHYHFPPCIVHAHCLHGSYIPKAPTN
jgi:hypothetical protein